MPESYIVRSMEEEDVDWLISKTEPYSPLRLVTHAVAKRQLERAMGVITNGYERPYRHWQGDQPRLIVEAEKEIVRLYVHDEFCGLCGRYTDHFGEH